VEDDWSLAFNEMRPFARSAHQHFNDVLDYVWKSPTLIDSQRRVEARKRTKYFPLKGNPDADADALQLRLIRKVIHDERFKTVYPRMIASANLFAILSLYEYYFLALCKNVEQGTGRRMSDKERGIHGLRRYIRNMGVELSRVPFDRQILAAIGIRNCLVHANGVLAWSSSEAKIRNIITTLEFLSPRTVGRLKERNENSNHVVIEDSPVGERIRISNDYAHLVAGFARDHFCHVDILACAGGVVGE
jgi:hypothetical protein